MIKFYFSESYNSFKRAKLSSFITVTTTMIAILFTAFSIGLFVISNKLNEKLAGQVEITIFLSDSLKQGDINNVRSSLQKNENISSVKFLSREDAKEKFINETGENFESILEINPLPASFTVKVNRKIIEENRIENIASSLKRIHGVDDVVYDFDYTLRLLKIIESVKLGVYIASAVLVLLSVYLIYFTNRLIISSKMNQFNTMKLVGAKLSALKIPLYITGIVTGLIAALFSIILFNTAALLFEKLYSNVRLNDYIYFFNLILLLLGCFFGLVGGLFSTSKISLKIENNK
ncbi:MAG: permease-like cell division protein FtsX [Bacteroidetes bacterium]|nr:permease-like cell division protein FtsX [Bacteroidota bacterium]